MKIQSAFYSGPCVMPPVEADATLYQVTGRVVDDVTGGPVTGATVSLNSQCAMAGTTGRKEEDYFRWRTVTDQDGKFSFDGTPATGVGLAASRDDYLEVFTFRRAADDPINSYVIGSSSRYRQNPMVRFEFRDWHRLVIWSSQRTWSWAWTYTTQRYLTIGVDTPRR